MFLLLLLLLLLLLQSTPAIDIAGIAAKIIAGTWQADWNDVGGKLYRAVKFQECDIILRKELVKPSLVLGVYLPQFSESVDLIVGFWKEKLRFLLILQSYL